MEKQELSKAEIVQLIKSPNPLIFEIGCYDGKDSNELHQELFRNSIYHSMFICFEADKRSQDLFINQNYHPALNLIPLAVGNIDGEVFLHLSDSDTRRHEHNKQSWSASSSLKKPKHHLELFKDVEFIERDKVQSVRLDSWYIQKMKGQIIDFMWVDINGAEGEFIEGALQVLQHKTKYLYIEFSDKELYEGQITKKEILSLLPDFKLIDIYNFIGNFGNMLLLNTNLCG